MEVICNAADGERYASEFANHTADIIIETRSTFAGYYRPSVPGGEYEVIEEIGVRFWHIGKSSSVARVRELVLFWMPTPGSRWGLYAFARVRELRSTVKL